jgi:hypothetical protein
LGTPCSLGNNTLSNATEELLLLLFLKEKKKKKKKLPSDTRRIFIEKQKRQGVSKNETGCCSIVHNSCFVLLTLA